MPVSPSQSRIPTTPPTDRQPPRVPPQHRHEVASGSGHSPAPAAQSGSSARTWLDATAPLPGRGAIVSPTDRMMAGTAEPTDSIVVMKDELHDLPTPSFVTALGTR